MNWYDQDHAILDVAVRRQARPDLSIFSIPSDLMPDQEPFEVQIRGAMNQQVLKDFAATVRAEINARQNGKTTPTSGSVNARDVDGDEADRPTERQERAAPPAPQAVSATQASLEEIVAAQIARLGDELHGIGDEISNLLVRQSEVNRKYAQAIRAQEAMKEDGDVPKGNKSDGPDCVAADDSPADAPDREANGRSRPAKKRTKRSEAKK